MAATLPLPPAAPRPAVAGIQRGSRLTRLNAWLRLASTDLGSKEHQLLLEWVVWTVVVSVVVTAILLVVTEEALRNLLAMSTLVVTGSTGLRRWLVYKQKPALSIVVLLACVLGAALYAQQLDTAGQPDWAVGFLVGSVLIALVTWLRIEAPAGI